MSSVPAQTATAEGRRMVLSPRASMVYDLRELWAYRELLYFLTLRDVTVRYRQAFFGVLWAVIQPVMLMVVFGVFLAHVGNFSSEGAPYAVFTFCGLVPWLLFSNVITMCSRGIVANSGIISKVYFPRLVVPLSIALSFLVDYVIAFVILEVIALAYGITPTWRFLAVFPLTLFVLVVALSLGIFFAALNARYRDVGYAVPLLVQVWLFATPVAYSATAFSGRWQNVLALNPMTGVVEGFRWAVAGVHSAPGAAVLISAGVTLVILAASLRYFVRAERFFADII